MASPEAILGAILGSQEGLEGQFSVFEASFSIPLGSRESSTASDRAKLYDVFLRGRRQWPQAISYGDFGLGDRAVGARISSIYAASQRCHAPGPFGAPGGVGGLRFEVFGNRFGAL